VKRLIAGLACSGILILSGCAAGGPGDEIFESREGCAPSGSAVNSISVTGEFGQTPVVEFSAPLTASQTQRLVLVEGTGAEVKSGDQILIDFTLINSATGLKVTETGYGPGTAALFQIDTDATDFAGVSLTAACSTVGSRVVGLVPAADGFGDEGLLEFGIGPGDGLIFVLDIVAIQPPPAPPLERIEGEPKEPAEGFPGIEYAESGEPTVVIPEGDMPTELLVDTVIEGSGAVLQVQSTVTLHYTGVNWVTGEVFDSSWSKGAPYSLQLGQFIPGFRDGLLGKTVGSRVLMIIPADLAYGDTGVEGRIGPGETIFFVVDVLGIQ